MSLAAADWRGRSEVQLDMLSSKYLLDEQAEMLYRQLKRDSTQR